MRNSVQQRMLPTINAIIKYQALLRTVSTMMTEEMIEKHTLTV